MNDDVQFVIDGDTLVSYTGGGDVVIPSGVKRIGAEAFAQNKDIVSVDLNEVTEVNYRAFYCCFELKTVIAKNVVTVGDDCFRACHSLQSVVFGKIERVGAYAFYGCMYCTEISGTDKLAYIDSNAFNGTKLKHIDISPDTVRIGGGAFSCSELSGFTVPKGIKSLESCVFSGCEALKSVELPEGLECIESGAFFGCDKLKYIALPSTLKDIGAQAFERCRIADICNNSCLDIKPGKGKFGDIALHAVHVHSPREGISTREITDGYVFCVDERTDTPYLLEYLGDENKLTLPRDFHGKKYRIYKFAFAESDITSVDFGGGAESIENLAFYNCKHLTDVRLDGVAVIDRLAFKLCEKITFAELDDVEIIGVGAFLGTGLQSIVIGKKLRELRRSAFDYCREFSAVYYKGTPEEFDNVKISGGEGPYIKRLTRYYSEQKPTDTEHKYWRYVNNKIIEWNL